VKGSKFRNLESEYIFTNNKLRGNCGKNSKKKLGDESIGSKPIQRCPKGTHHSQELFPLRRSYSCYGKQTENLAFKQFVLSPLLVKFPEKYMEIVEYRKIAQMA